MNRLLLFLLIIATVFACINLIHTIDTEREENAVKAEFYALYTEPCICTFTKAETKIDGVTKVWYVVRWDGEYHLHIVGYEDGVFTEVDYD